MEQFEFENQKLIKKISVLKVQIKELKNNKNEVIHFCILKKDEKTYNYVARYIDFMENESEIVKLNGKSSLCLGNRIQLEEIDIHLCSIGIDKRNRETMSLETIAWINENGAGFRAYINSIKIIALMFYCRHMDCDKQCNFKDFTFENFIHAVDDFNKIKLFVIDTIF